MSERLRPLLTLRGALGVALPIALIAGLHYGAPHDAHSVHDIARRLFYVPIVLGAALGGWPGGVLTALAVWVVYFPHAFLPSFHGDPGGSLEKALEMGLYVVLGALSGAIVDRLRREQARASALVDQLRATNAELEQTLVDVRDKDAQLAQAARLEALGQLTAGLAHEIKNPLHAMRGTAEIVLDAVPVESEEHAMGQALVREIDRLDGLLKRFLGFARRGASEVGPVELGQVVTEVETLVRAQASKQGTALSVMATPVTALAVHDQVVQVVLGICLNAFQAVGEGGAVQIRVLAEPPRIRVENDGPPIPDDLLEHVFDPFVSGREGGTGLGLATAWALVRDMGGALTVENVAEGVAFEVELRGG